jgi:hypothetical protein
MEVSGQLHAPAALPPRKQPLDRWLGGLKSRSGRGGEDVCKMHYQFTGINFVIFLRGMTCRMFKRMYIEIGIEQS